MDSVPSVILVTLTVAPMMASLESCGAAPLASLSTSKISLTSPSMKLIALAGSIDGAKVGVLLLEL